MVVWFVKIGLTLILKTCQIVVYIVLVQSKKHLDFTIWFFDFNNVPFEIPTGVGHLYIVFKYFNRVVLFVVHNSLIKVGTQGPT